MIQGLAVLNYSGYEAKRWHATLIMIAFAGIATIGNTFGKKLLPLWETLGGALHVLRMNGRTFTRGRLAGPGSCIVS